MSRGIRGRWLFLALPCLATVVAAALAPLGPVLHTSAQPVGGAFYAGAHSGGDAVEFWVSGDGSQVQGFTAYDVPGDTCEFEGQYPFPLPLDIVGDSFGPGIPGLYEVSGSFPSEGNAQGTLRLVNTDPLCDSGVLDWTSTASAATPTPTATPTPACQPGVDVDSDGFDNDVECHVGTDPLDSCPDGPTDDAWPLDNDIDRAVSVSGDVFAYVGKIGAAPGSPNWMQRLDIDMDSTISVTGDVFMFIGNIGLTCT
jgi:hypothetical protein